MNPRFDDRSFTVAIVGCGGFIGSHLLDAVLCRTKWRVFGVSYISSLHVDALSNLYARGREVEIHTHSFTVGRTSIYSEVKYGSVRIIVD